MSFNRTERAEIMAAAALVNTFEARLAKLEAHSDAETTRRMDLSQRVTALEIGRPDRFAAAREAKALKRQAAE